MKLKWGCLVSVLLVLGFVAGCAKPPIEEMNIAAEAVIRAENDADAVLYAGISLARARDALNRMQAEADSKRYDAARTYAAEAIAAAEKALADGQAGAARAREEAASLISGLRPMVDETGEAIRSAQSAELDLDYSDLEQDFDTVLRSMDQAETALAGDEYQDALENAMSARTGISDINQTLTGAVSGKK